VGHIRPRTVALKMFRAAVACRPFGAPNTADCYHTKKYATTTIAAIATANQIICWVV
jgi:hypothetical protein